jgi:hypothetical protein
MDAERRTMTNSFLVAIDRADGPGTPRLALLFLVRSAARTSRDGRPTPRQIALEQAARVYPLPPIGSVERAKMLIAARTRGLVHGDPPTLTDRGDAMLAPFDQAVT